MSRKFIPTEEQRKTVKVMSGFGVPQPDIAIFLDIDPKTLRKHFRAELDRGTIEANVKVAQTLFNMATVDKNVAAAIFWMKARAGWREKHLSESEEEAKPTVPGKIVVSWITPNDVEHSDQFPNGQKRRVRDIEHD